MSEVPLYPRLVVAGLPLCVECGGKSGGKSHVGTAEVTSHSGVHSSFIRGPDGTGVPRSYETAPPPLGPR